MRAPEEFKTLDFDFTYSTTINKETFVHKLEPEQDQSKMVNFENKEEYVQKTIDFMFGEHVEVVFKQF